jgi:hypothetical protein
MADSSFGGFVLFYTRIYFRCGSHDKSLAKTSRRKIGLLQLKQ